MHGSGARRFQVFFHQLIMFHLLQLFRPLMEIGECFLRILRELAIRLLDEIIRGAACLAPNMKRITGPNTGALARPTIKSPDTDV